MNVLESYITENPFGVSDECALFTVNDVSDPFVLYGITVAGKQYTLGFWVKSETAGNLKIQGKNIATSTEWSRQVLTFDASAVDLVFDFATTGIYYIYHPKLEIGNKDTDYTPAPEDFDESINDTAEELRTTIIKQNTSLANTCEEIILEATKNYVLTGDYETFKNTISTQLEVMAEGITAKFTATEEQLIAINGELSSKLTEYEKRITLSADGIGIHGVDGGVAMEVKVDNDLIAFYRGGEMFGWWDGDVLNTGNIEIGLTKRVQIGAFSFIPRSSGHMSLLKTQ